MSNSVVVLWPDSSSSNAVQTTTHLLAPILWSPLPSAPQLGPSSSASQNASTTGRASGTGRRASARPTARTAATPAAVARCPVEDRVAEPVYVVVVRAHHHGLAGVRIAPRNGGEQVRSAGERLAERPVGGRRNREGLQPLHQPVRTRTDSGVRLLRSALACCRRDRRRRSRSPRPSSCRRDRRRRQAGQHVAAAPGHAAPGAWGSRMPAGHGVGVQSARQPSTSSALASSHRLGTLADAVPAARWHGRARGRGADRLRRRGGRAASRPDRPRNTCGRPGRRAGTSAGWRARACGRRRDTRGGRCRRRPRAPPAGRRARPRGMPAASRDTPCGRDARPRVRRRAMLPGCRRARAPGRARARVAVGQGACAATTDGNREQAERQRCARPPDGGSTTTGRTPAAPSAA